jgi:hypothetical protein
LFLYSFCSTGMPPPQLTVTDAQLAALMASMQLVNSPSTVPPASGGSNENHDPNATGHRQEVKVVLNLLVQVNNYGLPGVSGPSVESVSVESENDDVVPQPTATVVASTHDDMSNTSSNEDEGEETNEGEEMDEDLEVGSSPDENRKPPAMSKEKKAFLRLRAAESVQQRNATGGIAGVTASASAAAASARTARSAKEKKKRTKEEKKPAPMKVANKNASARLVVTKGPYEGEEFLLGEGGKILFGIKPSTKAKNVDTISLPLDTNMQANHARLDFCGNKKCLKIKVTNMSAGGRTLVDGNPFPKERVAFSGMTITIGETVMRVESVSN